MPPQDSASTKVIRALSYLAEKYPGTAVFTAGASPSQSLDITLAGNTTAFINPTQRILHHAGSVSVETISPDLKIRFLSAVPARYRSARTYIHALRCRYRGRLLHIEDHIPVIGKLIDQDMLIEICKGPLRQDRYMLDEYELQVGWGNGYIGVPPDHPWYETHDGDLNHVRVHGGITYQGNECPVIHNEDFDGPGFPSYLFWVGFDTGHFSDTLKQWPKERVFEEAQSLYLQAAWAWAGISNPMRS